MPGNGPVNSVFLRDEYGDKFGVINTDGTIHIFNEDINNAVDGLTTALKVIDYAHHEVHGGSSFHCYFNNTTANSNDDRSGIYIKTPAAGGKLVHLIVEFQASTAADMCICEAPTIAANVGTHTGVILNKYRDSIKTSGCFSNATTPLVNRFTTLNEVQIAGDGTWALGLQIMREPLVVGSGPKPAGGSSRGTQEWILKANTAYVFLITNTAASINVHHISLDWYEH